MGGWTVTVLWTAFLRHLTRHPLTRMEEQASYEAVLVWNRPTACLAFRSVSLGGYTATLWPYKACMLGHFYCCCKKGFKQELMIYLLTAIGLTHGGSSTVHIYTQTIYRTTLLTNWEECGLCPVFASYTWHLPYNWGKARKNLGQGSRRVPAGTMKIQKHSTKIQIHNNKNT